MIAAGLTGGFMGLVNRLRARDLLAGSVADRAVTWEAEHAERGCLPDGDRPYTACRCECPDHRCIERDFGMTTPVACQTCGDAGFVREPLRLLDGELRGGRASKRTKHGLVGLLCSDCASGWEAEDVRRRQDLSGISPERRTCELRDLDTDTGSPRVTYERWLAVEGRMAPLLTVAGPPGSGKTHGATAVALAFIRRGRVAYVTTVPRLLDRFRETFEADAALRLSAVERLPLAADLLVLDDFGVERGTAWAQERLFSLIDERHANRRPTIVTTNLTPEEVRALSPRLASRMLGDDGALMVATGGRDRRVAGVAS